ncbi:hypothetical protein Cgig2_001941 [Carnegiea gigantea]|uniref:Uncharacterized protein n=1 Tax=Carnegiea gigantea TaxID=171969 RepID=A0A9Q1K0X6_9CARY|nr:hypothetical protein Cgig2_001941 [Carnegiea gigantea]
MASSLSCAAIARPSEPTHPLRPPNAPTSRLITIRTSRRQLHSRISASSDGIEKESYLGMWKRAVDREKKEAEFLKIAENTNAIAGSDQIQESPDPVALEKKSHEFQKILEVPREERDRVQRMQVIDRAAAAIAAARALLKDNPPPRKVASSSSTRTAGSADNFRTQSPDGEPPMIFIFLPGGQGAFQSCNLGNDGPVGRLGKQVGKLADKHSNNGTLHLLLPICSHPVALCQPTYTDSNV